jgi:purine-binding chemotaxis protein CheW
MSQTVAVGGSHRIEGYVSVDENMYVTMRVNGQLFGVYVKYVRDVLRQQHVTPIPLAPRDVSGSLNLRGRIVTVIDVRSRLGFPKADSQNEKAMFVVVEIKNELYSLKVDSVGEVLTVSSREIEKPPAHLDASWQGVATGIHKLKGELLVIVDVQTILSL